MMSNDILVEAVHEIQEETDVLLSVICMATLGGLVSWLRQKGPRKWSRLIVILCTAGFAGLLAYYITSALGLNAQYQCAMSGIAGYGGGTLLDDCVKKLKQIIDRSDKPA